MAKRVAIIGAGPVGLAAAAHALERDLMPMVLEAGDAVGHAVRQWSHVRMFSPWSFNVDQASEQLLASTGWNKPDPDHYPTGGELVAQYLEPLATHTSLADHIQTGARVVSVARVGFDKVKTAGRDQAEFEIRYQNGRGPAMLRADAVVDVSGTWSTPNPAGVNGTPAMGEPEHAGASPTQCRTCSVGIANAMQVRPSRSSAPDIQPLEPSLIWHGCVRLRPTPRSSGCCAATDRRRHLAAAPMTSCRRAANWAPPLRRWSAPAW